MNHFFRGILALPLLFAFEVDATDTAAIMELASTTAMPGVKGRIDHLAVDPKARRIFVAALGNDTVEIVDAEGRRHGSIRGFREPQGIAYVPESDRIFVANGEGDRVDIVDASSLTVLERIGDLEDADNLRYDDASRTVLAGYGKGALAVIDAAKGQVTARIPLPGHPESFQLERKGPRVYVNVPTARKVVVVDRRRHQVAATWDVPGARANYPMALDEDGHRLFVGARSPAVMLVFDTESGKVVARVPIGEDTDDIDYDAERKRIYVICGEGRVDVIRQESPDRYSRETSVETAPRARTGIFVPGENRLYVAAPASGEAPARILAFHLR
jgi:DNA-binding beta-propeller fold protein YncE